mmetsp:Transcript_40198/g.71337  ORF Transcript_40198/g.71337 Transcript_40198/m.71337 type:complete len:205 (+) Transcript_40198:59-673(+)
MALIEHGGVHELDSLIRNLRINASTAKLDRTYLRKGNNYIVSPKPDMPTSHYAKMGEGSSRMKTPSDASRFGSSKPSDLAGVSFGPTIKRITGPAVGKGGVKGPTGPGDATNWTDSEWAAWVAGQTANMASEPEGISTLVDLTPMVEASDEPPTIVLEADWTAPIANTSPAFFSALAAQMVEDDAPLLSGSLPFAAMNYKYGML